MKDFIIVYFVGFFLCHRIVTVVTLYNPIIRDWTMKCSSVQSGVFHCALDMLLEGGQC